MSSENSSDQKQAYLIIAHKDDLVFRYLIKMLDNSRNDIYVHMDLKNSKYNEKETEELVHHSKIEHVQRTSVTWGGV